MEKRPLVTIAIPTFNRAASYLKNAIMSAVNQTYSAVEIIVSDNGSTDNTYELVNELNSGQIRYFRQEKNIGAVNNSNFALEQARGEYFLLLHDDDMIDADFVETCMDAVNDNTDYGVILTGNRVVDENGIRHDEVRNSAEGMSVDEFFLSWFDHRVPVYLSSALFNTSRLKEIGGFKSKTEMYDDAVAIFILAARYGRKDVSDVKSSFRRHSNNSGTVASSVIDWCEDSLYLLETMSNLIEGDKYSFRIKGLEYFTIQNYIRAERIDSIIHRMIMYCRVYKAFEYSYSPIRYIYKDNKIYNAVYSFLSSVKEKFSN